MTRSGTTTHNGEYFRLLHTIVFAIAMLSISLHGPIARADTVNTSNARLIVADIALDQPGRAVTTENKRPPRRLWFRHVVPSQSSSPSHGRNTMNTKIDNNVITAAHVAIALNEVFPESSYGAIPTIDQRDALAAYLAFDDGTFDEVPQALAAYIDHQQRYAG